MNVTATKTTGSIQLLGVLLLVITGCQIAGDVKPKPTLTEDSVGLAPQESQALMANLRRFADFAESEINSAASQIATNLLGT